MLKGINGNKNSIGILPEKIIYLLYQTFKVHLQQIFTAGWMVRLQLLFIFSNIVYDK